MPVGKYIDGSTKNEIISKIRDQGLRVVEVANQYGISSKTRQTRH